MLWPVDGPCREAVIGPAFTPGKKRPLPQPCQPPFTQLPARRGRSLVNRAGTPAQTQDPFRRQGPTRRQRRADYRFAETPVNGHQTKTYANANYGSFTV
mgnify:CR=1